MLGILRYIYIYLYPYMYIYHIIIMIKPANKRSAVFVWNREDYIKEVKKQLDDQNVYAKSELTYSGFG